MANKPTYSELQDTIHQLQQELAVVRRDFNYKTILDNSYDVVWAIDLQFQFTYISPSMQHYLGYQKHEFSSLSFNKLVAPGMKEYIEDTFNKILSSEIDPDNLSDSRLRLDVMFIRKNRTSVWGELIASPIVNTEDKITGITGTIRDISNRKQREISIRQSNAEKNALFSAIIDVIIVFDNNGRYLKISPEKPKITYKPVYDIIGNTVYDVLPSEVAGQFITAISNCLQNKKTVPIQYKLEIKGHELWFDGRISPVNDETVVFVGRDITRHKKNEEQIKKSEEKLKAIFANSIQSFILLDANYHIQAFNEIASQTTKYFFGETLKEGQTILKYVVDKDVFEENYRKALSGKKITIEAKRNYPKKRDIWQEFQYAPVYDSNNNISGVFFTINDISKRKQAEEQRLESDANMRAVFENSHLIYILIDEKYHVKTFNQLAYETVFRLTKQELAVNQICYEILPFENKTNLIRNFKQALSGRKIKQERRYETSDNKILWYEVVYNPAYSAQDKLIGIAYSVLDITRRKQNEQKIREQFEAIQKQKIEIETINAELYTANEELHASNEELYTTNEELNHLNQNLEESQEKLSESEEKFRNIVQQSCDGIVIVNTLGNVIEWNAGMEDITGYKKEEVINCPVWDIQALLSFKENKEELTRKIKMQVQAGMKKTEAKWLNTLDEIEIKHKNGDSVIIQTVVFPIETSHGIMLGAVCRDITAQKNAENALKESELRFRSFIVNSSDGMLLLDETATVVQWNKGMEAITNMLETEIINEKIWDLKVQVLPVDKNQDVKQTIKKALTTGEARWFNKVVEKRIETKYANRFIQAVLFPVKTSKGYMIGGIFRDITAQKKAQEENNYLAAIVQATEDHATIKDLNLRVIAANKAVIEAAGKKTMQDVIGKTDVEIFGDNEVTRTYMEDDLRAQKLKKGEFIEKEEFFINSDGTKNYSFVKKFPVFNNEGELIATANISRNIDQWKKAQKALRESEQKLRELNITKDKFFSIIAHDLKNPFSSIISICDLILTSYDEFDEERIKRFIELINESSNQGYAILANLLEWSRAQTGRLLQKIKENYLYPISMESVDFLDSNAKNKNITVSNSIHEDMVVYADKNMLSTIFRNLLSNAIKFTPQDGRVDIKAEYVFGRREKKNNEETDIIVFQEDAIIHKHIEEFVHITMSDTGIGIKHEDIDKLFRLDVNFSTVGTNNEEGTGLGLILCKEFIDKNKGKIWVESQINQGTTFHILLPKSK